MLQCLIVPAPFDFIWLEGAEMAEIMIFGYLQYQLFASMNLILSFAYTQTLLR